MQGGEARRGSVTGTVVAVDPDEPVPVLSDDDVAWALDADEGLDPAADEAPVVRVVGASERVPRRGRGAGAERPPPERPVRWQPDGLEEAGALVRPVTLAEERTLPVLPAVADLLPGPGLTRGSTLAVDGGPGATSLALAVAAGPSQAGSWVAVVGLDDLGLAAMGACGVDLERVVLVDEPPGDRWGAVVAALVGAFDVVVVVTRQPVRAADARRLAARARDGGSVLVVVGGTMAGPGAPTAGLGLEVAVRLTVTGVRWVGLELGHGHLRARKVRVARTGRGEAAQPRRVDLWLPAADGQVALVEPTAVPDAPPRRLRAVG